MSNTKSKAEMELDILIKTTYKDSINILEKRCFLIRRKSVRWATSVFLKINPYGLN